MLELLFLLLPVAAGYGWVMGRNSLRQAHRQQSKILSKHYFKGLNFLLSDQPDKAVDTLIKMISDNSDAAETHIAMGNFFRHRGELDRAIRIHQSILSREELEPNLKDQALKELGRDYILAGFLERAEGAFLQLLKSDKYFLDAHDQLFNIYQTTKEWEKAIELAERMMKCQQDNDELCQRLGHFYCERAQLCIKENEPSAAEAALEKAILIDDTAIRPWLMLGQQAIGQQKHKAAMDYLAEVIERDDAWMGEVVPLLEECAEALDDWQRFEQILAGKWQNSASAYLAEARLMAHQESEQAAIDFLLGQLKKRPTMRGFRSLMRLYQKQNTDADVLNILTTLSALIDEQIRQRPRYRCHSCGFAGQRVYWLCPSCKNWGQLKPIKGLDGE